MSLSRKNFLKTMRAVPAAWAAESWLYRLAAQSPAPSSEELIDFSDYDAAFRVEAQTRNPRVKCFDLRELTTAETPSDQFFTFHQTATPRTSDPEHWRLQISGCVQRPLTLTLDDLRNQPATELAATIECSGNSGQARLMNGLVSSAVWKGPSLESLLRNCGVLSEAREVVFFGADAEKERKWPAADREFLVPHGRSIFVQDAMDGSAILALQLNGQPLSPDRGYPVRAIVPGWYGMTHVKWLNRIVVLDRRYEGRHMARNYHSVQTADTERQPLVLETSIGRMKLKSVVARVTLDKSQGRYAISGAAWSGEAPIERVEVRVDDGPWMEAQIYERGARYAWALWRAPWPNPVSGPHVVVSRAIDARGQIQPDRSEWARTMASAREDNSQWPRRITLP